MTELPLYNSAHTILRRDVLTSCPCSCRLASLVSLLASRFAVWQTLTLRILVNLTYPPPAPPSPGTYRGTSLIKNCPPLLGAS